MNKFFVKLYFTTLLAGLFFCASGLFIQACAEEPAYNPEIAAGPEYDFRKIRWGMSIEEVKASEKENPDDERTLERKGPFSYSIIYYDIDWIGNVGQLIYLFAGGKLVQADMHFMDGQAADMIVLACTEVLGAPKYDNISKDKKSYFYGWTAGKTKIILNKNLVENSASVTLTFLPSQEITRW